MKTFLVILAFLVTLSSRAATPTFGSFDTNQFNVNAAANTIVGNTNPANPKSLVTQTQLVTTIGSQVGGSNYSPIVSVPTNALFQRIISVESFGAVGDGVTDDTTAFQNAINSITNTGGKIILQNKVYFINGQFTAAPGSASLTNFAQLHVPARNLSTNPIVCIWFEGVTKPTLNTIWNTNTVPAPTNNCTILSTRVPTNNLYSIIAGGAPSGSVVNNTAVYLRFDNIDFRTYDNPTTTALNLSKVAQATIKDCVVETGTGGGNQSAPTNGGFGIIMPENNNWVISEIINTDVRGYATNYMLNEHSDVADSRSWMSFAGWYFPGGTHAIHMGHTVTTGCSNGIVGPPDGGFIQRITWDCYATEHSVLSTNIVAGSGDWASTVQDIYDPNNGLEGTINFASVLSGSGAVDTFSVVGSTNLQKFNLNTRTYRSMKLQPGVTNDANNNNVFTINNGAGVGIVNLGTFGQPFQNFGVLYLGANSFYDTWQIATNFSLSGNGTNNTTLNVGQPEGSDASTSRINFQVGHVNKMELSNGVFNVEVPINHGFIALSNYVSGATNVNTYAGPIRVAASISLVKAAVSGAASMQLWIVGTSTNTQADTTTATTIADTGDFRQLIGWIPQGASFIFTNQSTGAGNSSTLFKTEVQGD
jgi:hypothetical protein